MADYEICTTESELNQVCLALSQVPRGDPMNPNCIDVETFPTAQTPLLPKPRSKGKLEQPANDRFTVGVAGFAISWADKQAVYFPINHTDGNNLRFDSIVDSNELELYRRLNPYLTQWEWTNHRERYDWGIFKRRGVYVNYRYCTYVEAMLTGRYFDLLKGGSDGEGYSDAGLKSLVLREFGYAMQSLDDIAIYPDGMHIERVPAETAAHYTCDDVNYARRLHKLLYPQVKDQFLWKVEMLVSHLVEVMEENGIPFREGPCKEQLDKLQEFVPLAREVIYSQVERQLGRRVIFNIDNPHQLREVFFQTPKGLKRKLPEADCINLPAPKFSRKTGAASTDAKTLERLSHDWEVVHNALTFKKISKAEDSFLATLPQYIHPHTGNIHSTFHQGGVPAGRFSSSSPNAQNWSDELSYVIKDNSGAGFTSDLAKKFEIRDGGTSAVLVCNVRNCVEVDDDELLVAADYRQAEFWGALEEAKEVGMLELIAQGYDPHDATASLMYHVPITEVSKVFRKKAKTRNFAMLFGETDKGAAYKQGITEDEARTTRLTHESALRRLIAHRDYIIAFGRQHKGIYTHFGRWVDLSQLYDHPDRNVQEKGDRLSYNAFIQGSFTGDMPKIAMSRCMTVMRNDYPNYPDGTVHLPIIHNGHDALMFRLTPKVRGDPTTIDLPKFVSNLVLAMEIHIPGFMLPARVDVSVGRRYGQMISIHDRSKAYAGQSAVDVIALIDKKQAKSLPVNSGSGDLSKSQSIRINLGVSPTQAQVMQLKGLLVGNPGKNLVVLNFPGATGNYESVTINNYPTSLSLKDASKFNMVVPCQVLVENVEDSLDYMANAMENIT